MKKYTSYKNYKIIDALDACFVIMYALAYDDNISSPTMVLKENIIKCVVALNTRKLLSLREYIGLWLLCSNKIPIYRKK